MIEIEGQRMGRNKETTVNHSYISSGEYKRKFDSVSNNIELSRILYKVAREMLLHRSGTKLVVEGYLKSGYNENEAQIMALKEIEKNFDINFKEVTDDGNMRK